MTIEAFRRVLRQEADALAHLADQSFPIDKALDAFRRLDGNLFLTGFGKSGHIARKVASTFCSLGRPAFYIAASDLAHGDLGAIRPYDVVIMFTKSGSRDLIPIVKATNEVQFIVITSNRAVADLCHVSLFLPDIPEACHLGLGPTTSTTMMLALGDALAVADATQRNFTCEQFARSHPGGTLGQNPKEVA